MIIECQRCQTRFQLDRTRIPAQGAKVRCSRCQHRFHVDSPDSAAPAASAPGSPEVEKPGERGKPSSLQDNATTLQPRSTGSDDPDLENPEFIFDPERQRPDPEPAPAAGTSLEEPLATSRESTDEPIHPEPSDPDLGAGLGAETPYDGRSLSQLDPSGLDLSRECDGDASARAEIPSIARPARIPSTPGGGAGTAGWIDPSATPGLGGPPPAVRSPESPSLEARSAESEPEGSGTPMSPGASGVSVEAESSPEPGGADAPDLNAEGGARIERVARSPSSMWPEATLEQRATETHVRLGVSRVGSPGAGPDPWAARLRPAGLAAGLLLGLVIPAFLIAGLLAPAVTPPDVAAAGWTAREIEAFHAPRGDGGVALVVEGRLIGKGPVPGLRLVFRDADGVSLDVEAHLLAGRLRPFDLERALARPAATLEAAARAGGFTFVVREPSARARRYSIRLEPPAGA